MTTTPLPDRKTQQEAAGAAGGLFLRHGRMVYGVCRAMLRDALEAEDATQQVFLSAYQAMLGGVDVREHGRWLATIARNECRGRIAAGMRRPLPVAEEDLDGLPATGDEYERHARLEELRAALAELPERQREAVVLRYLYGLRYGEVATALGLSRPATEALLFRARRTLRGRLRPVVGAVLVVPSVVREELALALPGFGGAGSSAAALGATGGLLGKLAAGPVGVKAATAVVAVSTVGAVGTVASEPVDRVEAPAPRAHVGTLAITPPGDGDDPRGHGASSRDPGHDERSGHDSGDVRGGSKGESSHSSADRGRADDASADEPTGSSTHTSSGGTGSGPGTGGGTIEQKVETEGTSSESLGQGSGSGSGSGEETESSSGPSGSSGSDAGDSSGHGGGSESGDLPTESRGSSSDGGGDSGGGEPGE